MLYTNDQIKEIMNSEAKVRSLLEQRDIFRKELTEEYKNSLLSFWNWLMENSYLEEGLNGKIVIQYFLRRHKENV